MKIERCPWVPEGNSLYETYHDEEWGVPVHDDKKLFEFLVLESAQAGLSWITILKKREGYRRAFGHFDPGVVALFTEKDIDRLLLDDGIVRHRAKISGAISNAIHFLEVQKEYGTFAKYVWQFVGNEPVDHGLKTVAGYPVATSASALLAADLRKRGFKFLGPTTCYAYMQATGMVNDHAMTCFRHDLV